MLPTLDMDIDRDMDETWTLNGDMDMGMCTCACACARAHVHEYEHVLASTSVVTNELLPRRQMNYREQGERILKLRSGLVASMLAPSAHACAA